MKKTIAILLVLVIGMVGVFAEADTGSADLYLTTTVDPINQMAITATSDDYEWTNDNEMTSIYPSTSAAFSAITDDEHFVDGGATIAYLQARSNNRAGVILEMQAKPLLSTAQGSTEYIDYTVICNAVKSSTVDSANGTKVTIETLTYDDEMISFKEAIDLQLDESLENAADGTYEGSIVFSFTAS